METTEEFRYMTYEQRAAAGYRAYLPEKAKTTTITVCRCGKTVLTGTGVGPGIICPRAC